MGKESQYKGWNYKLVKYFLENRQLTVLLLLLVVIAGVFSYTRLKVEGFPQVQVPIAVISVVVPGAGPEAIDSSVTLPMESALRDIKSLKEISSTSQNNASVMVLSFEEGADMNSVVQEVRTKVSTVSLPSGARTPEVNIPETSGAPFIIGVAGNLPLDQLVNSASKLRESITSIEGVKSFTLSSDLKESIYIDLPAEYQRPEIINQIRAANTGFPLGQAEISGSQIAISGAQTITNIEQIKAIPIEIRTIDGKSVLTKLGDIASVYGFTDSQGKINRIGFREDGEFKIENALLYSVEATNDADILDLNKKIEKTIDELEPESGVSYTIVQNQAEQSQQQIDEIIKGSIGGKWDFDSPVAYLGFIFGGIWLLVLALLFFLDWRSALISAIAIPLSFLITFIALQFLGVTLNTMVLFSLVLVLGLIVDPAIVVLESIKRYEEAGYSGKRAVLKAAGVIGGGVFVAVLTSLVVFLPFGIVSGILGEIIKYIPLTVVPALIASYLVPMIFLTWLGEKFLKPKHQFEVADENDPKNLWPTARWFIRANQKILNRKGLQITIIILSIVVPVLITGFLFSSGKLSQVQFAQPDDSQYISVSAPRKANSSDVQLSEDARKFEGVIRNEDEYIKNFFYGSFDQSGGRDSISAIIELLPPAERDIKSSEIADRLEENMGREFGELVVVGELGAGPPTDAFPVAVKIYDNNPEKLLAVSKTVADQLKTYSEVTAVKMEQGNNVTELSVVPKNQNGYTGGIIYGQLASILGERVLFVLDGKDVILRVPPNQKPQSVNQLKNILIYGPGSVAYLGTVADIQNAASVSSIQRFNGERFLQVNARVADQKDVINVQRRIDDWATANAATMDLTPRAFENRSGANEFEKSFSELFSAIGLSIILTYIIFVLFFKSFIQPFIVLFAVPLAFLGVFPALAYLTNGQFGFLETLGIIVVIGIVENVGIFLIDYANKKVDQGMDKKEAIALSAGVRFRPIILTKITALAGLLPLAIFAPFWRGLSLVVIAGIVSSGVLSLFTTPILYSWFKRTVPVELKNYISQMLEKEYSEEEIKNELKRVGWKNRDIKRAFGAVRSQGSI